MRRYFVEWTGVLFAFIGLSLLAFALNRGTETRSFLQGAQRSEGTVVKLVSRLTRASGSLEHTSYAPIFDFVTNDGRHARFVSNEWSREPDWEVGDHATIIYDPREPSHARRDAFFQIWVDTIVLGIMGVVFGGVGTGLLFFFLRKRLRNRWLRANGLSASAKIVAVRQDRSMRVNGTSPYVIKCSWSEPLQAKSRISTSEAIWFDPVASGLVQIGGEIRVRFDPKRPKHAWVDVDSLVTANEEKEK